MTNMEYWRQINAMQPGPDLDRLVAERVMGIPCTCEGEVGSTYNWYWGSCHRHGQGGDEINYSASEANAWKVLKAVESKGNVVQVTTLPGRYVRVLVEDDSHGPQFSIKAQTFPEAMCKVALLDADWRRR